MLTSKTEVRIRYAETDQMGYVYYGNYAQFFEIGRVEALRSLGYTYRFMEENGVMMPVAHMDIDYHKPAKYDDLIQISTFIKSMPTVKMVFEHEIHNEAGLLLATGKTILVFVDMSNQKITRSPEFLIQALAPHFA
jgi:acyl-CoA thioester hydrolase